MGNRAKNPGIGVATGSLHGRAKLDDEKVLLIRRLAHERPLGSKRERLIVTYAKKWGVAPATLWRAATGGNWKHLPGAFDRAKADYSEYESSKAKAKAGKKAGRTGITYAQLLRDLRSACLATIPKLLTSKERRSRERGRCKAVAVYAKMRANGVCEACDSPAPFKTAAGEPYLEVHHLLNKSEINLDDPRDVAAICPTCHRRIHHGERGREYNRRLIGRIEERESFIGVREFLSRASSETKHLANVARPQP